MRSFGRLGWFTSGLVLGGSVFAGAGCAEVPLVCEDPAIAEDGVFGTVRRAGGGGRFSEDPPEANVVRREGVWRPAAGEGEWTDTYAEGFVLTSERWEGRGSIDASGDLDLALTRERSLSGGESIVSSLRWLRVGCDVEVTERDDADEVVRVENATYRDGGYAFRREFVHAGVVAEARGRLEVDGSGRWEEGWRVGDTEHDWERQRRPEGSELASFLVRGPDRLADGVVEVRRNGATTWSFTVTDGARQAAWDLVMGPGGNGRGTVLWAGGSPEGEAECEVTIDDRECSIAAPCGTAVRPPCWRVVRDGADRSSPCCDR